MIIFFKCTRSKKAVLRSPPYRVELSRHAVRTVQAGMCWICDGPMTRSRGENANRQLRASEDHLVPRFHIKADRENAITVNNVLYAHEVCNRKRGNRLLTAKQSLKARMILIGAVAYELSCLTSSEGWLRWFDIAAEKDYTESDEHKRTSSCEAD